MSCTLLQSPFPVLVFLTWPTHFQSPGSTLYFLYREKTVASYFRIWETNTHWSQLTYLVCCRRNLLNVLDFLKRPNAGELVSGTRDRVNLHDKFENAIESTFPGTIDQLVQKAEEKKAQEKKLSFWDSVTDSHAGAFKFSF